MLRSGSRLLWEGVHKIGGYGLLGLGFAQTITGVQLSAAFGSSTDKALTAVLYAVYGAGLVGSLLVGALGLALGARAASGRQPPMEKAMAVSSSQS